MAPSRQGLAGSSGGRLAPSGVRELELFRCGNRLVMVLEVIGEPRAADTVPSESADPACASLGGESFWRYQQALPFARPGEKWVPVERTILR